MQSERKYVTLIYVGFRKFMFEWFPSINSGCASCEATPLCVADRTVWTPCHIGTTVLNLNKPKYWFIVKKKR